MIIINFLLFLNILHYPAYEKIEIYFTVHIDGR
jgi:hypothetical protein